MTAPPVLRRALCGGLLMSLAALAGCGRDAPRNAVILPPEPDSPPAVEKPSTIDASANPTPPAQAPKLKGVSTPTSARELARVIDLRTFPRMEGAKLEPGPLGQLAGVRYKAPGTVRKAMDFYIQKLTDAGWQEHDSSDKRNVQKQEKFEFVRITATKQDHVLSVHLNGETGKEEVQVSVYYNGNFDARTLPRAKDGELSGDAGTSPNYSHAMYTTADTIKAAEEFARKALSAAGWQEYSPDLTDNRRVLGNLDFRNRGVSLGVYISKAPALGNKTSVQYNVSVLSDDVPTTAGASDVRLQDDQLFQLQYETELPFQAVIDFYKKELPALGWKFREGAGLVQANTAFVYFDAENKDYLAIDLSRPKTGKTLVKATHFPPVDKKGK